MKKIILSILFIAFVFAAIGQNIKGYYVEALTKLETKRAFVIDLDTFFATTQLSGVDTILATKAYTDSKVSDLGYDSTWDSVYSVAPSKNAVYDKINSMEPVDYCPDTTIVNKGTISGGSINNLCAKDGNVLTVTELAGTDPLRITFTFTNVVRMNFFIFYGAYIGGANHVLFAEIYNPITLAWDYLGVFGLDATAKWHSFPIYLPNTYISGGNVQIRIAHQDSGNPAHYITLDYVDVNFGGGGGGISETASEIAFVPTGSVASTNVQTAIAEVDSEKAPITGGSGYIQNQTLASQSANYWINGIGYFGDSKTIVSTDPVININRTLTGAGNSHAFSDASTFQKDAGTAYNSFDSRITVSGSSALNHIATFQSLPTFSGSTVTNIYGMYAGLATTSGTVGNNYGFYSANPTGTGTITNNFGIYVAAQTAGTNNYAFYAAGTEKSFFNGNLHTTAKLHSGYYLYNPTKNIENYTTNGVEASLRLRQNGFNYWDFLIPSSQTYMTIGDASDILAKFNNNAGVELNYNGSKKFETFANGIITNGTSNVAGSAPVIMKIFDNSTSSAWTAGAKWGALQFHSNDASSSNNVVRGEIAMNMTTATGAASDMIFSLSNAGVQNELMRLSYQGQLLLGTTVNNVTDKLQVNGSILGTTAKFTNLTDTYIPKHTSDATGLENSNIFFSGNIARYGTANTFSNDRDIPDKAYVDAIAAGNMAKLPVDAATTANITLSGTQTIDGYAVTAGMRVLVKNQSTASQNGVYTVAAGAWARSTDLDTWAELYKAYVAVLNGTVNGGASYVCTIASTGTLETDPITWVLYNAPANILVNSPLSKTGNTISLNYDTNTIDVASGNIKVKDNVFQPLLNGTGFVKASGTTITYDNSTYLTAETDPIFAADSANLLYWSDTLNTTKGIATPYDLSLKQNTLTTGNLTENVTGLQFDNTRQVIGGSAQLSLTSGYFIPTTTEQTNWNTAYTDRNKWDGGATGLVAATGRTSLGGTTIGQNVFTSTNPSAIRFLRANADNTVSWLDAADFRTAIGVGTGTGTVTSVSMTVPTGFSISGSPITSSGTLGLTYALGYSLPTTASQSNWDAAYSWGNHAVAGYLTQSSFNSGNADLAAIEALAGTSGLLRKTAANTWSLDNSPYITGNQTITLSGNVTGSGTTSIATTISNSAITASMLNATDATSGYFLRYVPAGSGLDWEPINFVPQTRTLTINGTTYDLSANRSWTVSASPAGSNTQVQYNNLGSLGASANFTFNSGTGVVTALNFQLGSDKRLKTDIKKLDNLDWVDKVKFVSFKMKSDSITERYGVIAQDLEKINSNLVNENLLNYKTVSYIDLIIAKVARQDEKIKDLTERIEALEKLLTNKILTK